MSKDKLKELKNYFHQLALLNQRRGQMQAKDANRHARDMMQATLDQIEDEEIKIESGS